MRVDLATPLAPGASLDIEAVWHFNVPPQGGGRMGHDGPLYEMAQWYPRLCVYDDVHGWNHEPYIGAGEFYLEYGNFDVSLTVPASYIVAATGRARKSGAGAHAHSAHAPRGGETIRDTRRDHRRGRSRQHGEDAALASRERRRRSPASLTWHFTATNVRDFAFAAGPNFRWDASGYDGILIEDRSIARRPTSGKK